MNPVSPLPRESSKKKNAMLAAMSRMVTTGQVRLGASSHMGINLFAFGAECYLALVGVDDHLLPRHYRAFQNFPR